MDPLANYVPNNPQFGVQLECNWSATLPPVPSSSSSSSAVAQDTIGLHTASSPTNNSHHLNGDSVLVVQDELTTCWTEDMGSFALPLDLEPLPSLFPFSPCSGNSNSYKSDLSLNQHHGHNPAVFSLRGENNKQPAEVADVLLSLKHAVVHPGQEHVAKCESQHQHQQQQQQQQHLYHPQVLLSPGGYAGSICEQNFAPQASMAFPAMSVNVSMNMTMHGYHPASNYPTSELTYPQVQWNPNPPHTVATPMNYQAQGLLSPAYTGATYSFTADFRPPPPPPPAPQPEAAVYKTFPPTSRRKHANTHHIYDVGGGGGGAGSGDDLLDGQKPNVCRICGKSYARPSTLKTHLRTHSGEKPYRCVDCNKSFSQAANLTAHVRTHSGEKPFRCPVCDRRFSQSSSVTTHMRTHSGERPYRCRLCKKAFSDSSTLTKHLRIHSGEKPYECKLCLLRFSQSGNLNRHMRVHGNNNNNAMMMPP